MASLFGRKVVGYKLNNSGGQVIAGDVLVPDTTANNAFTTTTSAAVVSGVWVADETIASGATGRVVTEGHVTLINVSASVTRGHTGTTHTVAKQAVSTGSTARTVGTFCKFTTGGTTPEADIWPVDLLGSSLTNPMTTKGDIIIADTSGTPTRLAAGATSGMVLTSAGSAAFETFSLPPGYEFTYTAVTSIVTVTVVAEASSVSIVSAGAVTYDGSTAVYIEWFLPEVFGPSTANADVTLTLWEDATDLGQIAVVRSETTNRGVTSIHGRYKRTPTNASHNYTIKGFAGTSSGGAGGGTGGAGALAAGYCRVVKA